MLAFICLPHGRFAYKLVHLVFKSNFFPMFIG